MGALPKWPVFASLVLLRAHTTPKTAVTHVEAVMDRLAALRRYLGLGAPAPRRRTGQPRRGKSSFQGEAHV
jgi:hypothetical protein